MSFFFFYYPLLATANILALEQKTISGRSGDFMKALKSLKGKRVT